MNKRYKIGFDIGGTISKFPDQMLALMRALTTSAEFEVFIVTDMKREDAISSLEKNSIVVDRDHLICADWSKNMDLCKSIVMKERGIDIMIDDRPDYITEGVPIGLALMPRPHLPYFHPTWKL
jgi:hypothetical protein